MDAVSAPEPDRAARQHPRSFLLLHVAGVIVTALIALSFTARLWGTPRYITPLSVCGFLGCLIVGALCWYAGEKWGMRECRHAGAAGFHVLYFGVRPFTFRKRERLVTNRSRLPDETFAQRVSTEPELGEYLVATRKVVATACRVDPGVIYDTHDPFELAAIMGLDITQGRGKKLFLKYLGEELGLSLGIDFSLPTFVGWRLLHWKGGGPEDFGTWALEVAKRLREYS